VASVAKDDNKSNFAHRNYYSDFEAWVLKQMHLEQRCGKEEKHKCCLLGALQTENYCVSNAIDFLQQLIFQSGCSMSESLRTLSRRNMIVS